MGEEIWNVIYIDRRDGKCLARHFLFFIIVKKNIKRINIQKAKIYEEYEYGISKHTEDIYGTTNFVLPIKHSNKNEIAFTIWGLGYDRNMKEYVSKSR